MHNIVAIKIIDRDEGETGVLTFGRIYDEVDHESLLNIIRMHCPKFGVRNLEKMEVCWTIQEVSHMRFFYEAYAKLLKEYLKTPTHSVDYDNWVEEKKRRIYCGQDIYSLGFDHKGKK